MLVNQIAVFLENRQGRLYTMLGALSDAGVNVESLNIADTKDFGIVRIITDDNAKAVAALSAAGFTTASTNLVGIEVDDVPGSLTSTLGMLNNEGVNLEYVYSYSRKGGKALILFKTDDGVLSMIWSNFSEKGYVVAVASSDNGLIEGKWSHRDHLLYEKDMRPDFTTDGGHAMIFIDNQGKLRLALHGPNGKRPDGDFEHLQLFYLEQKNGTIEIV